MDILLIKRCGAANLVRDYMLFKVLDLVTAVVKEHHGVVPAVSQLGEQT